VYQGLTAESSGPLDPIAENAFDCGANRWSHCARAVHVAFTSQVDRAVGPDQLLLEPSCGRRLKATTATEKAEPAAATPASQRRRSLTPPQRTSNGDQEGGRMDRLFRVHDTPLPMPAAPSNSRTCTVTFAWVVPSEARGSSERIGDGPQHTVGPRPHPSFIDSSCEAPLGDGHRALAGTGEDR
jgi:hypothetical protein